MNQKLVELYQKMVQEANAGDAYSLEWANAIETTLNMLNIKVEGINDGV